VASIAAFRPTPATAVYSATKAAVRTISEGLRQEVKPYDIRTTLIAPGAVATELPDSINDPDIARAVKASYATSLPPASFARIVAFAIGQPKDVDINEVIYRPTGQVA